MKVIYENRMNYTKDREKKSVCTDFYHFIHLYFFTFSFLYNK